MDDLVQWLRAQLDEDERIVRAADMSPEMVTGIPRSYAKAPVAIHIATFADPARVLRGIDAKRQLLDEHHDTNDGDCSTCVDGRWGYPTHGGSTPQRFPCRTLRLLALPYADRPSYREEWRL
jgi:hypothetical protein